MMKINLKDTSRRFVYVVGRIGVGGLQRYAPSNPYDYETGTDFDSAKVFSQRAGAAQRANRLNRALTRYGAHVASLPWSAIPCEVVPVDGSRTGNVSTPVQRYTIRHDRSSHKYLVPVENLKDWSEWMEIPDDDPWSWVVPPFAKRIDGNITFTNPETETV